VKAIIDPQQSCGRSRFTEEILQIRQKHSIDSFPRERPKSAQLIDSEIHLPRKGSRPIDPSERSVRLSKHALRRHPRRESAALRAFQHGRTDTKPTAELDGEMKVTLTSREPVQDKSTGVRESPKMI
jgi:hypothetical protein